MNSVEREDERIAIFERDGWTCQYCGNSVHRFASPQLAHLIADTIANRKRYGNCVIDHPKNRASTCSLYCNGMKNIGMKTAQANKLADEIRDELLKE
jgi:hypothetical protein